MQDFVYADDVAMGLKAVAECDAGSGIFNIGSGYPTTVASVVNCVASYFNRAHPFPVAEPGPGFWADTAATEAATGWKALTSVEEGISRTVCAMRRQ